MNPFAFLFAADSVVTQIPQYTSGEWIAIIGAIGLAVASIVTSLKSSKNSERMISAVVGTPDKQGLTGKLEEIHTATNSTLSESKADLKMAITKLEASVATIEELRSIIKDMKVEREKRDIVDAVAAIPSAPSQTTEQRLAALEKKNT